MRLLSIEETIERQTKIYLRSPVLKALGLISFLCVVIVPYILAKNYWYMLEGLFSNKLNFIIYSSATIAVLTHCSSLIFFGLIYWLNHPFFEQYKDNDRPWPWKSDPKFWHKVKKAAFLVSFNNLVVMPILNNIVVRLGILNVKTSMSEIPSFFVYICQIFFMLMCEDFSFFNIHRLFH